GDDVAVLILVVIERRPWKGMIFLAHSEETAETDNGKHYGIVGLVENDVLDLADLLAIEIIDIGADSARCADGSGVSGCSRHEQPPLVGSFVMRVHNAAERIGFLLV